MRRIYRLGLMSAIALVGGAISLYLANGYVASLSDASAKATVAAGEITLFGVIFSAFYKEVSAFYFDRSANIGKKWDLIYPLLKKYYYPWTRLAKSLKDALDRIDFKSPTDDSVIRYLYLTLVFYGVHMRFVLDDSGIILLSSTKDEDAVEKAYSDLQIALDWAGDDTPRRVSYLQSLYLKKTTSGGSYLLASFRDDLLTDSTLQDDLVVMKKWVTDNKDYRDKADKALANFISTFNQSMDRLYNAWSES
jgi:hypothetical protein